MKYLIIFLLLSSAPFTSYAGESNISEETIDKATKSIKFTESKSKTNASMHTLFVEIPELDKNKPVKCTFSVKEWNDSFFDNELSPLRSENKWLCHTGIELESPYTIIVRIEYENIESGVLGT